MDKHPTGGDNLNGFPSSGGAAQSYTRHSPSGHGHLTESNTTTEREASFLRLQVDLLWAVTSLNQTYSEPQGFCGRRSIQRVHPAGHSNFDQLVAGSAHGRVDAEVLRAKNKSPSSR